MKINQFTYTSAAGFLAIGTVVPGQIPHLILIFGSRELLQSPEMYRQIKTHFPEGNIVCCSTSGEILGSRVYENTLAVTAVTFEKTRLDYFSCSIHSFRSSYDAGKAIAEGLLSPELRHIFLLSDGQLVNGSSLVKGITESLPPEVSVTGGLAGDGVHFDTTVTGLNAQPEPGQIVAIGFYGDNISVGYGSRGGWDQFGPDRLITKSKQNVLFEVDGQSALDLYKKYLGAQAEGLPGSALRFPIAVKPSREAPAVVRTVLSIDEKEKTMTFAGDMPEGWYGRLMKASPDRLIDGATGAAQLITTNSVNESPELAILISCVGRKLVLNQRTEEEVEAVLEVLGAKTATTGFYSYGEISPFLEGQTCELHNQTMTITTFREL